DSSDTSHRSASRASARAVVDVPGYCVSQRPLRSGRARLGGCRRGAPRVQVAGWAAHHRPSRCRVGRTRCRRRRGAPGTRAADRPVLVDFARATTSKVEERGARDLAELLASTAAIVGDERAVTAAVRALGYDGLAALLPMLQPAALSRELRSDAHGRREHKE